MKHLPIPFEQQTVLNIKQGAKVLCKLHTELAKSPIEHFQALLYRKGLKENSSVTFVFENTSLPGFVNTNVPFDVDLIQFDQKGEITHLGLLTKSKNAGIFISSFQTKYLLMVPKGFIKKHKLISANKSKEQKVKPFQITLMDTKFNKGEDNSVTLGIKQKGSTNKQSIKTKTVNQRKSVK
jgi:uncharacterized membrane protein (UPF0127 family)